MFFPSTIFYIYALEPFPFLAFDKAKSLSIDYLLIRISKLCLRALILSVMET